MPRKKNPHSTPYVKPDYHSQNKEKLNNDDNAMKKKSIKLRTSLDIYNRLMHDKTLNLDLTKVKIGYSDKVLGNQEVCILDWTMIDKGGDIPMHHILYFILTLNNGNKLFIWDRKTKLDRLYCSGVTKNQQSLNVILNSPKIKNIQSQNKSNDNNSFDNNTVNGHCRLNKFDVSSKNKKKKRKRMETVTKMPKQILQNDEMVIKYFPRYPTTDDGFVESFNLNDTEHWKQYLDRYGLVVLKVLTESEADNTIKSMCNEIYERRLVTVNNNRKIYKVDINNPFTWDNNNFPAPHYWFLTDRPAFSKTAFINRCCKKMYFIWKTIYNDEKLNVSIDRWGIQRGTKNLTFRDPETNQKIMNGHNDEQKQWRKNLLPHWDVNPWQYLHWLECGHYKYIYQGALALTEQRMCDGTHLTLPGCMNFLPEWCELNKLENVTSNRKKSNDTFYRLKSNDNIRKYMQSIPLRKGEMVIWNYGQLHANTKNMSNRMRLTQYIRYYPSQQKYIKRDKFSCQQILDKHKRDLDLNRILGNNEGKIPQTVQKLLGLKSW